MDPFEVGDIRYCWACGRKAELDLQYATADKTFRLDEDAEHYQCVCCKRPFHACPCTPVEEGACRAIKERDS